MSKKEKLLKKLKSKPVDFTFDKLRKLLNYLGYIESSKGKTSGSRVMFISKYNKKVIRIHKPHPDNILKPYQIRDIILILEKGEE